MQDANKTLKTKINAFEVIKFMITSFMFISLVPNILFLVFLYSPFTSLIGARYGAVLFLNEYIFPFAILN